jgi:hypothetical protein
MEATVDPSMALWPYLFNHHFWSSLKELTRSSEVGHGYMTW